MDVGKTEEAWKKVSLRFENGKRGRLKNERASRWNS
jgi:hypothetical protein